MSQTTISVRMLDYLAQKEYREDLYPRLVEEAKNHRVGPPVKQSHVFKRGRFINGYPAQFLAR